MASYTVEELAEIDEALADAAEQMSEAAYFDEVDAMAESFGRS